MRAIVIALTLTLVGCSSHAPEVASNQAPIPTVSTTSKATASPSVTPSPSPSVDIAELQQQAINAGEFVPADKIKLFPLWSGTDLEGSSWSSSSLRGKKTLVNFWASWCGPCRNEWPLLQQASATHPEIRFIGINTQDSLEKARTWIAENPTTYLQIFDERAVIKASLTTVPNMGMPITVVLNTRGEITDWFSGEINARALEKILG